ncbi:uncharacterized protein Z519_07399 [Cladophialophora bantiana CBS 173.52]|uniref:Uncharacterized protein n=1 Tax=Cladophialophora bantiana (strain ATCC 10958 / CBS 173.52 / CDC B-1940 / NIH 8579) TaxID=1442370 RepID=A0A0D2HNI3_CLAB1|nr:uncharacterized protein Z519_07399 [Cladophialophora bantiana CBS 173.52]KIW92415.1 hypothetical protein Z519_07399 [Cladophialophora bantiana CBS 173.52]
MPFQILKNYMIPRKQKSAIPNGTPTGEAIDIPRGPLNICRTLRWTLDPGNEGEFLLTLKKPLSTVLAAKYVEYYVVYSRPGLNEIKLHRNCARWSVRGLQFAEIYKHVAGVYEEIIMVRQACVDVPQICWRNDIWMPTLPFVRKSTK